MYVLEVKLCPFYTCSSTFYVIDTDHPKRYQTTILLTKTEYKSSDLCTKLKPTGSTEGAYIERCSHPRVFFWSFPKSELRRASSNPEEIAAPIVHVPLEEILNSPDAEVVVVRFAMAICTLAVETNQFQEILSTEIDALTKNRSIVEQMQRHAQLKRFTIESQTSSSFNVTKYSSSKEDIRMYNTEKTVLAKRVFLVQPYDLIMRRKMKKTLLRRRKVALTLLKG